MASSVSGLSGYQSTNSPYYDSASSKQSQPPPQLTQAQQMKELQHEGKSASQIANALGLPLTLVQSDLGETTAASTSTISLKA